MATENSNTLELSQIPRSASANRFQVNLVNKESNGGGNGEAHGEDDEDQFNEDTEIVKQRKTSRIQAIRSSFRDSDKKSADKKRKESVTRFKVSDENSDSGEDENLLDGNEYDTKYGRSFRYAIFVV